MWLSEELCTLCTRAWPVHAAKIRSFHFHSHLGKDKSKHMFLQLASWTKLCERVLKHLQNECDARLQSHFQFSPNLPTMHQVWLNLRRPSFPWGVRISLLESMVDPTERKDQRNMVFKFHLNHFSVLTCSLQLISMAASNLALGNSTAPIWRRHRVPSGTHKEESYCTHHKAPTMARQEVPFRNAQDPIHYTFLLASQ